MVDELLAEGRRHAAAGDADAAQASFHAAHACGSALAPYLAGGDVSGDGLMPTSITTAPGAT